MTFQYFGLDALLRIVSHLSFIYLAFWALQSVNLEMLFRKKAGQIRQIRCLLILAAIAIGYMASSFFLEVLLLFKNALLFVK
ncbi:MAG: DUF1146 family protein [Streptococcaceae bacterium]|jgi:uncharacterized integral membrane protein (TIGR02327 family)|nr:DUF1146 family protein [Streptococcaceae bacterium]